MSQDDVTLRSFGGEASDHVGSASHRKGFLSVDTTQRKFAPPALSQRFTSRKIELERPTSPIVIADNSETNSPTADGSLTASANDVSVSSSQDPLATLRWKLLVLLCLFLFGGDYCFDMPGSIGAGEGKTIQMYFHSKGKVYNQKMNQSLYAVYSYPSMVMALVGGLLIDKYLGLRKTALLMSGTVVVSSIVFSTGIALTNFPIMALGRFLFGCSGETLFVAQSAYLSRWFGGTPYMSLVFGLAISCSRLGGGASYMFSPPIARANNVVLASSVGFFLAIMSFMCCVGVSIIDSRCEAKGLIAMSSAKKHKQQQKKQQEIQRQALIHGSPPKGALESGAPDFHSGSNSNSASDISFQVSFIPTLPKTLWFLALCTMLCYGATFPFVSIAKTFFERVYRMENQDASFVAGLFHIFGAVLCPLMGAIVDRIGKSPRWLFFATSGLLVVFINFIFLPGFIPPTLVIASMSFFYAVFVASTWSFGPYTVPAAAGGFGFGVMNAAMNFGLASSPLFTGSILDAFTVSGDGAAAATTAPTVNASMKKTSDILPTEDGFYYAILFLMFVVGCGLLASIALWLVDSGCMCADNFSGEEGSGGGCDSDANDAARKGENGKGGRGGAIREKMSKDRVVGILMSEPSRRAVLKRERDDRLEELWRHLTETKMMADVAKEQRQQQQI